MVIINLNMLNETNNKVLTSLSLLENDKYS